MTPSALPPTADFGTLHLRPLAPDAHRRLAEALAAIPPWSTLGSSADALTQNLQAEEPGTQRYAIVVDSTLAGVLSVRLPWLKGPYIELLAILPGFQRHGIGTAVLSFVEAEAKRLGARNVWVCGSQFNKDALHFYKRNGFCEVASLPDLVTDGFAETLLRKTLT